MDADKNWKVLCKGVKAFAQRVSTVRYSLETEEASAEEIRTGTFASPVDERFFGAFFPTFMDSGFSIPERLLKRLFEVFANAYDVVG